jgi:hypothetical protein
MTAFPTTVDQATPSTGQLGSSCSRPSCQGPGSSARPRRLTPSSNSARMARRPPSPSLPLADPASATRHRTPRPEPDDAGNRDDSLAVMSARQHVNIDLDAEVASILRAHAAEAHVSEGEIVDRAVRAYDLRSLIARIRERSDLDEDAAMTLVREELHAARAERDAAA